MTEKRRPPNPALIELAQPEKLSKVLKDDQYDCLACRLTGELPLRVTKVTYISLAEHIHFLGASAFIGLGAYIYFSGRSQLSQKAEILAKRGGLGGMRGRMAGTILLSSSFVGMGLYRLVN
jgi:hypothetical protein